MHIFDVIQEEAVYNILGHCRKCWDYTYPTGKALEEAIYRGLKPFYPSIQSLGAPNTIVDVAKEKDAFDIKGGKKLAQLKKINKKSNHKENIFVEQILPGVIKLKIRLPKHITTMVKRPNVNMQNWKGKSEIILNKSIKEYKKFAEETTKKSNCDTLYSIVVLYGQNKKNEYRSLFFTLEKFSVPEIDKAEYHKKKNGDHAGYLGIDSNGDVIYSLAPFNRGSCNSYKRFNTQRGILYTWLAEEIDPVIYDESTLLKDGKLTIVT